MDINEIIYRIGYLRNRAKMSARQLSMAINKNEAYINRLETKKDFEPSLSALLRIIEECNSTPEEFFYYNIQEYQADLDTLEFLKSLKPAQKAAIQNLY